MLCRDGDWVVGLFYCQAQQYADSDGEQDVIIDDQLFLITPRWEVLDDKVRDIDNRLSSWGFKT